MNNHFYTSIRHFKQLIHRKIINPKCNTNAHLFPYGASLSLVTLGPWSKLSSKDIKGCWGARATLLGVNMWIKHFTRSVNHEIRATSKPTNLRFVGICGLAIGLNCFINSLNWLATNIVLSYYWHFWKFLGFLQIS